MPDGESLLIGEIGFYSSSITQGVIIIPKPATTNLFYLFQLQDLVEVGLKYSIVDMNADDGNGDVIGKNIDLITEYNTTQRMTAVKHGNGRDWWLLLNETYIDGLDTSLVYVTFLITPYGISGPFMQFSEQPYNINFDFDQWGKMAFSSDGSLLAYPR